MTDRLEQAIELRRKELIISKAMFAAQLATAAGIVYILAILGLEKLFNEVIILGLSAIILAGVSKTIGTSQALIRWYDTIIEQEESKSLRYGDGEK